MKINNYIVTVQWGEGIHYIVGSPRTQEECERLVAKEAIGTNKVRKGYTRGAKPVVRGWCLIETGKPL